MNKAKIKLEFLIFIGCLTALVGWSAAPVCIRYLSNYTDSWTQNMFRYVSATLFWMPFLIVSIRKKELDHSLWKKAVIPAIANIATQSCWALTLYYIEPALGTLLIKSSTIWIAIFSILLFIDERTLLKNKYFWFSIILSTIGVIGVLCFTHGFGSKKTIIGISLALLSSALWSVYVISAKIVCNSKNAVLPFSIISIYTTIGLLILAMLFGNPIDCINFSPKVWIVIVISGILFMALSHVLYYSLMNKLGATIPAIVLLSQPFLTLAISHLFFGEVLNIYQLIFGCILISGGVFSIFSQKNMRKNINS